MFKFSFRVETDEESSEKPTKGAEENKTPHTEEAAETQDKILDVYPCEELCYDPDQPSKRVFNPDVTSIFKPSEDCSVEYLSQLALLDEIFTDDIVTAESDHSDLIPNRYEGGLKVWECTFDLGLFLVQSEERKDVLRGKKVLDLGCGAGILGIEAAQMGAKCVDFQDYNKDVLTKLTMANFELNRNSNEDNGDKQESNPAVRFYSGDWGSFTEKYHNKYDLILTSETIYSTQNYPKLLELFDQKLEPDGVVYLAAKTYYFGVGGGARLFEKAMDSDGRFQHEVAWKCDSGVKREILKITRK
ncbi:histidine protein methyltransferase 1 homolog [Anopheles nili]|uniref:histidine protein methyltransferase 1 homolog n=1 Tax=Anopheles nili TaxID=185578 RepID=UPI00237BEE5E|nr:histidine protein methyltransferase 1 homolog [Anopheles nili]